MKTEIRCPKCGSLVKLSEKSYTALTTVIGKDSNLGTIYLQLEEECDHNVLKNPRVSRAEKRLEAMRMAGIADNYFLIDDCGVKKLCKIDNNEVKVQEDNDPVVDKIINAGSLHNAYLFKQHVMAQMLNMLIDFDRTNKEFKRNPDGSLSLSGYVRKLNSFRYDYSWKVTRDKLLAQSEMCKHGDFESFEKDNRWYNKELVVEMFNAYEKDMKNFLEAKKQYFCKGEPYIKYKYAGKLIGIDTKKGVFVKDIPLIFSRIDLFRSRARCSNNPKRLFKVVDEWVSVMPKIEWSYGGYLAPRACKAWRNAYKGYGAYFTIDNMIRFHGCLFLVHPPVYDETTGRREEFDLNKEESLKKLDEWAEHYKKESWWLLGGLKYMIINNKFDILAKKAEWRAKYSK